MTFNFDGGDILILLLVAIAFVLFRRFDRTGRSLEKVRKYADKSKAELDAIVRERELGLKDLAMDLEVQEQTNREILNRADAARDEILARAGDLESRVEKIEAHEKALEDLNELALRVDENLSRLKEESAYVDEVGSRLSEVRDRFSTFADKDVDRFAAFREEALGVFGGRLQDLESSLEETARQMALFSENLENINARKDDEANAQLAAFRDELERAEEDSNDRFKKLADENSRLEGEAERKIAAFRDGMEQTEEEYRERLRKVAEEGSRLEDDAFTALNDRIDSRSERLESNWMGGLNDLKDRVSGTAEEIQAMLVQAREDMERAGTEYRETDEKLSTAAQEFEGSLDELRGRVEHILESKETSLLESFEIRQGDYRKTVEDRFERIEGFIRDMDTLAESLKSSQDQTLENIEATFTSFDADMTERRDLEKARVEEESASLRQEMADLERGLDELKSRAYDNVSEKLQVFEDEFFTDLKKRDESMRSEMEEWRKNAELELGELGQKAARDREETERRYSTELRQKLGDLQSRVLGQFESFQDQVDGFRTSLNGRIGAAEEEIARLGDELSAKISADRDAALQEFNRSFDSFETEVTERFSKADKTISQRLADYSADIETRHKDLAADFQAGRDEITEWKERLALQMEEAVRSTGESVDDLKSTFSARISELEDEYAGRTEQLILESREERAELRRGIADQEEAISRLADDLTEKSRDSIDRLKDMSEGFLLEFQKSSREARDEMERKIRELRQSVQESRDRAETNRKEMTSHTDNEYARLMKNLDEIDKRQREFITETRVFDRADEMKAALEGDIAELNRQLEQVGSGRQEIRSINEQYEKAISLYDDVNAKLSRFLAEQQKVENLEGKIARIGSLSESVDLKLDRMTEANDTLQDLQVRLKQLEDLHEDLGDRYRRLVEKSGVLDAATEGVDRNFDRMTTMEEIIKDFAERLVPLRQDMDAAEEQQKRLNEDREQIELVAAKASSIDSTLAELDGRLDDLAKAREWLARTETRLDEIYKETQQNLKLMGTISKREGGRKKAGSPDMSTREMVYRLAREGWSPDEISRNLKLGQGEVELILELRPKDGD